MSTEHIVQVHKAVWGIKIAQAVLAVLVLAFSAFEVAVIPWSTFGFGIFVALFTIVISTYYLLSVSSQTKLYSWIALLVLECIAIIFWLAFWGSVAALLAVAFLYYSVYDDDYYSYKRDLTKRLDQGTLSAASALFYCTLALGLINWILYCVSLIFLSIGIHRHRKAGRPITASSHSSNSAWGMAPKTEKNEMNPMPSSQAYPNYAANGSNPAPAGPYEQPQYSSGGYPPSPVPANTHEMNGGGRY